MADNAQSATIPTVVAAEQLGKLRSNVVMPNLVRRDFDDEVREFGDTITITKRGALTVRTGTVPAGESSDIDDSDPPSEPTAVTVTLNRHKYVSFAVGDLNQLLARPDLLEGYAEDAAIGLSDEVDAHLLDTFDTASDRVVNSTDGVAVTDFTDVRKTLQEAKAPMNARYWVWTPKAAQRVLDLGIFSGFESGANALSLPQDMVVGPLRDGAMGRRFGFDHLEDQNASTYNSSANTQANIAFQREAEVLASRPLAAPMTGGVDASVVSEAGIGLRVVMVYNHMRFHHEVITDWLYGTALARSAFAVTFITHFAS